MNKILLLLIILLTQIGCDTCIDLVKMDKEFKLNCSVDSLYENPRNRYTPTIRLHCKGLEDHNFEMNGYYYPDLRSAAEIGDRVEKDSNSLSFRLIKQDGTIIQFCPYCDGKVVE